MEFFRHSDIDFMRYRRFWAVMSAIFVLAGVGLVFVAGELNVGIDFTGGTQLIVRFQEPPPTDELRRRLAEAGITDAQIQRFGAEESAEVMIRTPLREGREEGEASEVLDALSRIYNEDPEAFDLNLRGSDALGELLLEADPEELAAADEELARAHYQEVADAVLDLRQDRGIFTSYDSIAELPEVTPEILQTLEERVSLGTFALLGEEVVGPTIGRELRLKGVLAVVFAMIGMLAYIWVRFELRFGLGALLAITHDVFVTLGLFAFLDYEFNLSTIAAFLTLVGYSVNDTVVVFDRVRENMRRMPRSPFERVVNVSVNQTLSRTILTSGTTILAVGSLFVLGGEVLRGFSFVLLVGVVVGTYSSIFVASPFALFWEEMEARRSGRPVQKVRQQRQPEPEQKAS